MATVLSVQPTLKSAWERVSGSKSTFWAAIGLSVLIMFCFSVAIGILSNIFPSKAMIGVLSAIQQLINFLFQTGILYIGIQRAFDLPINYRLMFRTFNTNIAMRVFGVYILQMFLLLPAMAIGAIPLFLGIKGPFDILFYGAAMIAVIYLIIRMFMGMGFVLDKGLNPWEAIKQSFIVTQDNFLPLLAIFLAQLLIIFVGALTIIGLIWVLPFVFILYGVMYRNLSLNLMS